MEKSKIQEYVKKLIPEQDNLYQKARTCQNCKKPLKGDDDVVCGHPMFVDDLSDLRGMVIPMKKGDKIIVGLVTNDGTVNTAFCNEECAKGLKNPVMTHTNLLEV